VQDRRRDWLQRKRLKLLSGRVWQEAVGEWWEVTILLDERTERFAAFFVDGVMML
jgi:hypothetical protein